MKKYFTVFLAAPLVLGLLAAGSVTSPSAAEEAKGPKVTWNLSIWGNKRAFSAHVERLSELVAEKTGGNFDIKLVYGGALSPPKENIDGLNLGAFEIAPVCVSYAPGKTPATMALNLPFLPILDVDTMIRVHRAFYAHPAVAKEFAAWNSQVVMTTLVPRYEFMGVGSPPRTLDDWKGKRVRALGGVGDAMKLLGASPTSVPAPEVYPSLERGLVDAASFPFTYAFASYRLQEISKWYTSNLAISTTGCPVLANTAAWKALPDAYRKAIQDSLDPSLAAQAVAYKEADEKNLPDFKKRGLEAVVYSKEEKAKIVAIGGQPIWDAWIAEVEPQGVPGRELLQLILDTADKAS